MSKINYTNPYEVSIEEVNKPSVIFMTALSFFMIVFIFGVLLWASYQDTHYDTTAEVLTADSNETLFVDGAGYVWSVFDTNPYVKGQYVKLYFDNNRTDYTRNDDIIIKIKILDN